MEEQNNAQIVRLAEEEQQRKLVELQMREEADRQIEQKRRVEAARQAEAERQRQLADQLRREEVARKVAELNERRQIGELLASAQVDITALRLLLPVDNNAFEKYQKVLKLDAGNEDAKKGIEQIIERYVELSDRALAENDFAKARGYLTTADGVITAHPKINTHFNKVASAEANHRAAVAKKQRQQELTRQAEAEWQRQQEEQNVRYIDNGNGTVTDTSTNLSWQQQDDGRERNWQDSINFCSALNLGDSNNWRLPTKDELRSLIDSSKRLNIDPVFINSKLSNYWSASSANQLNSARFVFFSNGLVYSGFKTNNYFVRCVR